METNEKNKFGLIYGNLLEKSDANRIKVILEGLQSSFSSQDPIKGGSFYCSQLKKHISLKGKIGDEDKISLINLLQQLLFLPHSDLNFQSKVARTLTSLLKKCKELRGNVLVPWKPIYQLIHLHHFSSIEQPYESLIIKKRNVHSLIELATKSRKFFGVNSTREILDHFLPQLNDYSNQSVISLGFLSILFHPLDNSLDYQDLLNKFVNVWEWVDRSNSWDFLCARIICRIISNRNESVKPCANASIVSSLFTRFLKVMNVTLGSSSLPKPGSRSIPKEGHVFIPQHFSPSSYIAKSIIHLLPFSSTQNSMESSAEAIKDFSLFINTLESYFHPSNQGHWTDSLASLLYHLSEVAMKRVIKEGISPYSKSFADILLPKIYQGLYSKHKGLSFHSRQSVRFFSLMLPNQTFEFLLPKIHDSFATSQFPHQSLPNLEVLGAIFGELLLKKGETEQDFDISRFLYAALRWIDANHLEHTKASFKIFYRFLSFVPLDSIQNLNGEDNEFNQAKRNFAEGFEDWALQFMDIVFDLYYNQDADQKPEDSWIYLQKTTFRLFFEMQSPSLFKTCSTKLWEYLYNGTFNHAKDEFGWMIKGCVAANPKETLSLFLPTLHRDLIDKNSKSFKDLPDSELEWKLSLVSNLVLNGGSFLVDYQNEMIQIIEACFKNDNSKEDSMDLDSLPPSSKKSKKNKREFKKEIIQVIGELLRSTLQSLTHIYPNRHSPSLNEINSKEWGFKYSYSSIQIDWHVPNDSEIQSAKNLFTKLYEICVKNLERLGSKGETLNHLVLLKYLLQGGSNLLPSLPKLEDSKSEFEEVYFKSIPFECQADTSFRFDGKFLEEIGNTLHLILNKINSETPDDVQGLEKISELISTFLSNLHSTIGLGSKSQFKPIHHKYKHPVKSENKENSRTILVERGYQFHLSRYSSQNGGVALTPTVKTLMQDLFLLSESSYIHLRKSSQNALNGSIKKIPFGQHFLFVQFDLCNPLKDKSSGKYRVKRSIHLLNSRFMMDKVMKNWKMMEKFVDGMVNSVVHQDSKLQNSLFHLFIHFISHFYHTFVHGIQKGEEISVHYNNIVNSLLSQAENESNHWRYKLIVSGFLYAFTPTLNDVSKSVDEFGLDPQLYVRIFQYFLRNLNAENPMLRSLSIRACYSILNNNIQNSRTSQLNSQMETIISQLISEAFGNSSFLSSFSNFLSLDHELTAKESEAMESATTSNNIISSIFQRISSGIGGDQEITTLLLKEMLRGNRENYPNSFAFGHSKSRFSEINSSFWNQIFHRLSDSSLEISLNHLEKLMESSEVEQQTVLSESVAGLLATLKNSVDSRKERIWKFVIPILNKVAQQKTSSSSLEWATSIRFGGIEQNLQELKPLIDLIFENLFSKEKGKTSVVLIRQLLLLKGILLNFREKELNEKAIEQLGGIEIPSKQVSHAIGEIAAIVYYNLWKSSSPTSEKSNRLIQFASNVSNSSVDSMEIENQNPLSSILPAWILHGAEHGLIQGTLSYLPELKIETVFEMVKDSNEELSKESIHTLLLLSQIIISPLQLDFVLSSVERVSKENPNWNVRKTILPFLQILAFNHRFEMQNDRSNKIIQLITSLLSDPQIEVRELAKGSFASFIRGTQTQENFIEIFTKLSRTSIKKDVNMDAETASSNLIARHAGVLGLSALVLSCPYDVPKWMPELLSDLSTHINDPMPLKETVRSTFAEFWRTHLDEWEVNFKDRFTQNQLDNISGTQHTQNYYI
eukprot:TRINITY_DN5382_c0_g1_i1.p1 TRINITY_DN5382_c0_g1~~TRINITY_DN5382_c0_g1_i1.p1  ORF type:complete len:1737 (-),score=731.81 TRINITY_DN5382_c0_g1_i1:169-5379(-)